jgi:hypothetical protein
MIFGSLAAGAEKDLDDCVTGDDRNCATSKVAGQLSERADSWAGRANIAFVGAAVAAGVGVWFWLSEGDSKDKDDDLDSLEDDLNAWIGGAEDGGMAGIRGSF